MFEDRTGKRSTPRSNISRYNKFSLKVMWNLIERKYVKFRIILTWKYRNKNVHLFRLYPTWYSTSDEVHLQSELVHLNENDRIGRQSIFDFFLRFLFQWVLYSQNYSFKQSVPVCNQRQINDRFGTNNVSIVQAVSMNRLFSSFILITKIPTLLLSPYCVRKIWYFCF